MLKQIAFDHLVDFEMCSDVFVVIAHILHTRRLKERRRRGKVREKAQRKQEREKRAGKGNYSPIRPHKSTPKPQRNPPSSSTQAGALLL